MNLVNLQSHNDKMTCEKIYILKNYGRFQNKKKYKCYGACVIEGPRMGTWATVMINFKPWHKYYNMIIIMIQK